ncbi:MAG: ribosome biogenesis GTPase YlqF [Christensenellales bacterium]
MTISWYPGHMAKARRQLSQQLVHTDVVLEICDARLPLSSRNPDLDELVQFKQRVLLLNKADLADPAATRAWTAYFKAQGIQAIALNAFQMAQKVFPLIDDAARAKLERAADRGIHRTLRAMVVGVPNVGKSTLINLMKGKASIKTEDRPGVTRTATWFHVTPYLELMDSPGLLWPKLSDQLAARRLAYIGCIRDEVLDSFHLAIALLEDLLQTHPEITLARFKLADSGLLGQALLEAVCKSRGYLLRGGTLDLERAATAVLDEFRGGKIGRISLEWPPREAPHAG